MDVLAEEAAFPMILHPYRDALLGALAHSLDAAAFVSLHFLWERRATLGVIHPWFVAAYQQHANTGRCP